MYFPKMRLYDVEQNDSGEVKDEDIRMAIGDIKNLYRNDKSIRREKIINFE